MNSDDLIELATQIAALHKNAALISNMLIEVTNTLTLYQEHCHEQIKELEQAYNKMVPQSAPYLND